MVLDFFIKPYFAPEAQLGGTCLSGLCIRGCPGALSKLLPGFAVDVSVGDFGWCPREASISQKGAIGLYRIDSGHHSRGFSYSRGVNRGGGAGGFGFLRTVRIADGWAGGLMRGHWPALWSSLCWRLLSHLSYYSGCPSWSCQSSHPPAVGQRSGYQSGQPPGKKDKVIMLNND